MPLQQTTAAGPANQPTISLATSPQITNSTTASVAAGGQTSLDSTQISSGKTGKLLGLTVTASVPFKAVLQTVLNASATSKLTRFSQTGGWDWISPAKNFITAPESVTAGFDGFRVVVTNQDPSEAADVYATFLYDEEA